MGIAPEIAQDGGRPTEGGLGVDNPVGGEQGVDEGIPLCGVAEVLRGAGEIELASGEGATKLLDKLPRKTRLRTFTGRKKSEYLGEIQR
jgi:hypothetical protein